MSGRVAKPERTCVSCRKKGEKGELVRLVNAPDGAVIDYSEKLPGRGAYVCPERGCIDKALKGGLLSRAFKEGSKAPQPDEFYQDLNDKVLKKIISLLGMARKSRKVVMGFDPVLEGLRKEPGGLLILALDLADNTRNKLKEANRSAADGAVSIFTKEALGEMLGGQPVGLVYVPRRDFSAAIRKEIDRLFNISRG